ncbi:hypothetical protein GCM10023149_28170 [Mucilaginibacter gynuensis]|uniref:Lipoprotein n=1 Tax=Mucilaginibacter gynuensis TaxID=1302236 RepID=A0ABP8GJU5_9SPHI
MKNIAFCFILITFCLASCVDKKESDVADRPSHDEVIPDSLSVETFTTAGIQIDSSAYVMYPLSLDEKQAEYDEYSSSKRSGGYNYWNITFYNTETKEYHLLSADRKMSIESYSFLDEDAITDKDTLIYYDVKVTDYNKDGKLNLEDPSYLFISNKTGNNFRQISPDGYHVTNWKVTRQTGKILISARADTNRDKKFDGEDSTIPFIYDVKTGTIAVPVFNKNFFESTNKLFDKLWPKKQDK